MPRKSITYIIQDEGSRDKNKVFVITEAPSTQSAKWAIRAVLALTKSGIDVPPDIASMGLPGLVMMGLRGLAGLQWEHAEALYDEMWPCVKMLPNPDNPSLFLEGKLMDSQIEEIKTILDLRWEIIKLHTDFFSRAVSSKGQEITAS